MYELVNPARKEFLVWIADDGLELSDEYLEALRPAHWSVAEQITMHTIESGLELRAALDFRDAYAMNTGQMPGWEVRVIVVGPEL